MSIESFLSMLSSLRNEFIYFAIAISLPSFLLYLAEMCTILRHKQFRNTFYSLVFIRSIPNLVNTLNSYFCYRLTILFGNFFFPFYESLPNWILKASNFCTFYTMLADYLATILILLSRWTAIKMPLRHKIIWRKILPYAAFIVFVLPLILYSEVFFVGANNQIDTTNDDDNSSASSFFIQSDFNPILDPFPVNFIISCAFMLICILVNISIFREYRKSRRQQQNVAVSKNLAQMNQQEKVESKLLAYALLTFVGHLLMAFYQVLTYVVYSMDNLGVLNGAIYTQYPWIMDFGTVVLPSWLLFWANDSFRRQLMADLLPKCLQRFVARRITAEITPVVNLSPIEPQNNSK